MYNYTNVHVYNMGRGGASLSKSYSLGESQYKGMYMYTYIHSVPGLIYYDVQYTTYSMYAATMYSYILYILVQ